MELFYLPLDSKCENLESGLGIRDSFQFWLEEVRNMKLMKYETNLNDHYNDHLNDHFNKTVNRHDILTVLFK